MNFKYVVAFLLGGFMLMMSILVYKSVSTNFYMVSDQYYEESVHYDQRQEAINNVSALEKEVSVLQNESQIIIQLPSQVDSGVLVLYRPSNADKDVRVSIAKNQTLISISSTSFDKGRWIAKLNWQFSGARYYAEKSLFIKE